jgi:hypothetical protein
MILNVSRSGLFVQTTASVKPGETIRVALNPGAQREAIPIDGQVVWKRVVAAHLRSVERGGLGLRIRNAPESYYSFLLEVADRTGGAGSDQTAAGPDIPRYQLRLKQEGGPRSRVLQIHSESEDEARQRALDQMGPGWAVLEIKRL